jgi:hypothetical protein
VLAFAQRALYDDMPQFVKLYAHAAPAAIETTGETNGAPGASAEAEDDKYEATRLKYTQRKLDPAAGASAGASSKQRRRVCAASSVSEYGWHRHRGGRERGGRERERDGSRPWDAERNLGWGARPREEAGVTR